MVREPDGKLRKANADERHTVNQIYFPQSGRELRHPMMFKDENLKVIKCKYFHYKFSYYFINAAST